MECRKRGKIVEAGKSVCSSAKADEANKAAYAKETNYAFEKTPFLNLMTSNLNRPYFGKIISRTKWKRREISDNK